MLSRRDLPEVVTYELTLWSLAGSETKNWFVQSLCVRFSREADIILASWWVGGFSETICYQGKYQGE